MLLTGWADWIERFGEVPRNRTDASILTGTTLEETLEIVSEDDIDCLLIDYEFDESTGIKLLRSVRTETASLSIVMCASAGSEAIASEAIAAGVTDYVALDEQTDEWADELLERTEQCVRSARRTITQRNRARQFDAIFHDTQTATWVLDPEGSLERANRTARAMIDADIDSVVGQPFRSLPWWSQATRTQADVHRTIERTFSGAIGNAVVSLPTNNSVGRTLDLSARPVENERGELVSIIVEGVDITERVELERDLRQSEKLHRVTLNNMTDTVLITNEAHEYTYVRPNVNFIFGYSADEIHEQGTIDALFSEINRPTTPHPTTR